MSTETTTSTDVRCPTCGNKGRSVKSLTLRALLNNGLADNIKDVEFRFCHATDCNLVYYGSGQTFTKLQLKVPVGVKETSGERPLCYCFGHSIASITEELRTKGSSEALHDIRRKMKDPGCRCETENPSGSCCLGSVTKGITIAQEELERSRAVVVPAGDAMKSPSNRGEAIAKVGTVVSAIMASSCCWLPLVLLAFGVSGAGFASTLEAYRPWFMVVTFSFLAAAFYYTYRPKKSAADGGHDCCATRDTEEVEDCCFPDAKRRYNVMALNKVMLWGVTAMAVAFLLFPSYVGAFLGGDDRTVTKNMNRTVFSIDGMTCKGCSSIAAKAISDVPGVLAVEVDYEKSQAAVGTEACCPVPKDEIVSALKMAGYSGKFIESGASKAAPSATKGKQ